MLLFLNGRISLRKAGSCNNSDVKEKLFWVLCSLSILIGGLSLSSTFYLKRVNQKKISSDLDIMIKTNNELLKTQRKNNANILISDLIELVQKDIEKNLDGELTEETIAKIIVLNSTFEPIDIDTHFDSLYRYSPERGLLLYRLLNSNLSDSSLFKIYSKVSFEGADLEEYNLTGKFLNNIDLRNANLRRAILSDSKLKNAQLSKTILDECRCDRANFNYSIIEGGSLIWADFRDATLDSADLNSVKANNANFTASSFKGADMRWLRCADCVFKNVDLSKASLREANLLRTNFQRSRLIGTNLIAADLSNAQFQEAEISNSKLLNAKVASTNWLSEMEVKAKVFDSSYLETYEVESRVSSRYHMLIVEK